MNKKNNRKGFTIVELVIVIAVIAILATVLVPTFGDVITKANKSAAMQEAKNTYTNYVMDHAETGTYASEVYYVTGNYTVHVVDGATEIVDGVPTAACYELLNEDASVTHTTPTDVTCSHVDDDEG